MSEILIARASSPTNNITAAKVMRDALSSDITKLIREYEGYTGLVVDGLTTLRKEKKDRRGYKSQDLYIGVLVRLPGNGVE